MNAGLILEKAKTLVRQHEAVQEQGKRKVGHYTTHSSTWYSDHPNK